MAQQPNSPQWMRTVDAAREALAKIDEPMRRLENVGGARQIERVNRQLENLRSPVARALEQIEAPLRRLRESQAQRYFDQIEQLREQLLGPAADLARVVERMRDNVEGPARQMQRTFENLSRLLEPYDIAEALRNAAQISERIERALRASLPSNWRELSYAEAELAQKLVVDHGVPIVWVPNPALTERVINAQGREQALTMLNAERDQVLDDVETALDEVIESSLQRHVELARKAVATLRRGDDEPAQALAAAIFTAGLENGLGLMKHEAVRTKAKMNPPDEASLGTYRTTLVLALSSRFVLGWGRELPGYNRNKTLHTVRHDQYTPEHALASVMTVAMLLREAEEIQAVSRAAATPATLVAQAS